MKHLRIKTLIGSVLLVMFLAGCKKLLEEKSRSTFDPGFFKTQKGVEGRVTSLYAHLRYIYGQAYYYNATQTGTDEATYAQSADGNFKDHDLSGVGQITSSTSRSDVIWGTAFSNINTASSIIEDSALVAIPASLVAEARFFRAFDYFLLVQTFGGVPLDLGSGELKFNVSKVRTSVRNTVPEVYTKAIFPDLKKALEDLPDAPRITGAVTKTVARLHLAKAYLTYGWWLQNPNNIPTYPAAPRTDPDGHDAQWYFQQAYNLSLEGIDKAGTTYGLMPSFYDLHVGKNDRNKEVLLYADHTEKSAFYNGGSLEYGSGGAPDNFAGWMMTWNYTEIRSSSSPTAWSAVSSVQREAEQHLGRPWTRMAPTIAVIKNTFADKVNDSRYDGTFTTVYRGNWQLQGTGLSSVSTLYNANLLPVKPGDAILTFLNDEPATPITYPSGAGQSNIGAGTLPGRADWVISPNGISRVVYPGLWKLGPNRTDNAGGLGQPNAGSTRPYNIAYFSEFYFIAAEAAVKGASTQAGRSARDLVNVIRARAGKWTFDNNGNVPKVADHSADMVAATPATIDINYILAERSREYYGEGFRWFDLVRTQKWEELAGTYTIASSAKGDHTPKVYTRTIQKYMYLRPIPIGQIDALDMSAEEKKAYQNPQYQ